MSTRIDELLSLLVIILKKNVIKYFGRKNGFFFFYSSFSKKKYLMDLVVTYLHAKEIPIGESLDLQVFFPKYQV